MQATFLGPTSGLFYIDLMALVSVFICSHEQTHARVFHIMHLDPFRGRGRRKKAGLRSISEAS